MNQYKSGKWTGEPVKKTRKTGRRDITQPVVACFMCAIGFGLILIIGSSAVPEKGALALSVSAGDCNVVEVPSIVENTTNDLPVPEETSIENSGLVNLLDGVESETAEEEFDADKYSTSLSSDQISEKLSQSLILEKTAEDNAFRSRNAGVGVSSARKSLYLDYYYYDRSQTLNGTYNHLNASGIPMSQYVTPENFTFDENGVPTNYAYYIDGKATAYYTSGRTATGTYTYQGTVAVDPRIIPYGSQLWITSLDGKYVYGYARAEDTGGFIYYNNGTIVDLFMSSISDCYAWGRRGVRIYVFPNYDKQ